MLCHGVWVLIDTTVIEFIVVYIGYAVFSPVVPPCSFGLWMWIIPVKIHILHILIVLGVVAVGGTARKIVIVLFHYLFLSPSTS